MTSNKLSLNKSQLSAVDHFKGPLLVISGPGSGKTTVIVNRIYNLIAKYNVNPHEILVLTYTKAAAVEMEERYIKKYGDNASGVCFGTFHSVFYSILRNESAAAGTAAFDGTASLAVATESVKRKIIAGILYELKPEKSGDGEFIRSVISRISCVKNGMNSVSEKNPDEELFWSIYREYCTRLEEMKMIDFDDMLIKCLKLFQSNVSVLEKYRERFKYIMIDEYQDINGVSYDIIKLMAMPRNNIFAVGDDDQSIYSFRGAKPGLMNLFMKNYGQKSHIVLDVNYRCPTEIIKFADGIISENRGRIAKSISGIRSEKNGIFMACLENTNDESMYVIEKCKDYIKSGIKPCEIAVLYRTTAAVGNLCRKMDKAGMRYYMRDKLQGKYGTDTAKDIIAYINLAVSDRPKRCDLLRVINKPVRYVKRQYIKEEYPDLEELKRIYKPASQYTYGNSRGNESGIYENIDTFIRDINFLKQLNPYSAINYIRYKIGYDDYIKDDCRGQSADISAETPDEILDGMLEDAANVNTYAEWLDYVKKLSDEEKKKTQEPDENSINLMSMHASKGLEFKVVIIIGANDGIIPHSKAVTEQETEEERRLLYVGCTRSSGKLHICYTKERAGKKKKISRFLEDKII